MFSSRDTRDVAGHLRLPSKEGGTEPLITPATDNRDPPSGRNVPLRPSDIQQNIVATPPPPSRGTDPLGIIMGNTTALASLQTYFPTGTWIVYTAFQTWAFSLRPNDAPITPLSTCSLHQRNALVIIIVLFAAISFFSSFIKRFVYDSSETHVLFPTPDYFRVAKSIQDPVTGVKFPCRTNARRYCWPLVNRFGDLTYDQSGTRLRVAVFRPGIPVLPGPRRWCGCFDSNIEDDIPPAPRLYTSVPQQTTQTPAVLGPRRVISMDTVATVTPKLTPHWSKSLIGAQGSASYVDLSPPVWGHALVSLLAFLSLSLLSTQVSGCLYPEIPDFLAPPLQTGLLAFLALMAAVVVRDGALSLGQNTMHVGGGSQDTGDEAAVPEYLRSVVERVVWVGRQDRLRPKKRG